MGNRPLLAVLLLAAAAPAHWAYDLAVDADGVAYFLDWPRKRLMKVSAEGRLETLADLSEAAAHTDPHTLALDDEGGLLVGATYEPRIWRVSKKGAITPFDLGPWKEALDGDAVLNLARTAAGLHMIVSGEDGRFRLLDPERRVLLDVRKGRDGYLNLYGGSFCVGAKGRVYLTADHRVWTLDPGKKPAVLAGAATSGSKDGTGAEARFDQPYGLCLDRDGTLLVADAGNGRIRRVDGDGKVTTLAVKLGTPHALCLGPKGRLHVAEYDRATIRIGRIDDGKLTVLAAVETR